MTIVEAALSAAWPSAPENVTFGYFGPIDGRRVDDPPPIAMAIKKAGSRHMSWVDALPALGVLGSMRAAPVTVRTATSTVTLTHGGTGWRISP